MFVHELLEKYLDKATKEAMQSVVATRDLVSWEHWLASEFRPLEAQESLHAADNNLIGESYARSMQHFNVVWDF